MLRGVDLAYRYGAASSWVFRGLDFQLAPGETVGLRGYSGCGKTTLGLTLAGYLEPVEGSVTVDDVPIGHTRGFSPVQLVFQHPEKAVDPRWRMRRVLDESTGLGDDVVERLSIERLWLDRFSYELSGGELQRFCAARALSSQTKYLIADEMTTMLDALTQAHLWHLVTEWTRENGVGLLVVSHDDALVRRLCDRIIDMPEEPEPATSFAMTALHNPPPERTKA